MSEPKKKICHRCDGNKHIEMGWDPLGECKMVPCPVCSPTPIKKSTRVDWDRYFLNIAEMVATRATCDRKHVGSLIVLDKMILSTGYNGSIRGLDHCDDTGHEMEGEIPAELGEIEQLLRQDHNELEAPDSLFGSLLASLRNKFQRGMHCTRTVHAEANAIVQAAKNGVKIDRATMYTTASPCYPCFKLIANAGITRIVFGSFYREPRVFQMASMLNIEIVDLSE